MELHRGRLIDHIQLVVRDLAASRRFYEAVFKVLDIPIGGAAEDYFWADELFVSTADSRAATGQVDRTPSSGLPGQGPGHGRRLLPGRPRRRRQGQWRAGRAALPPRLLRRLPARSRRQQHRGRVPWAGQAQCCFGEDHILTRGFIRYILVSRAIKRTAGDSNVGNGQGVRRLDSGKLRPLYGAVDFRAVRRRSCTTRSVLVAKRRFGNRRGHRGCHPRIGAKTVPRRKLCRNRPQPADARLRRFATSSRQSHQMAPSGCSGAAV